MQFESDTFDEVAHVIYAAHGIRIWRRGRTAHRDGPSMSVVWMRRVRALFWGKHYRRVAIDNRSMDTNALDSTVSIIKLHNYAVLGLTRTRTRSLDMKAGHDARSAPFGCFRNLLFCITALQIALTTHFNLSHPPLPWPSTTSSKVRSTTMVILLTYLYMFRAEPRS